MQVAGQQLTSRREADSSAHLDKQSKQHHMSWNSPFDLHKQSPLPLFPKNIFALFTRSLLYKKACLYVGADWPSSTVSQGMARGQLAGLTAHSKRPSSSVLHVPPLR